MAYVTKSNSKPLCSICLNLENIWCSVLFVAPCNVFGGFLVCYARLNLVVISLRILGQNFSERTYLGSLFDFPFSVLNYP